MEAMDDLYRLYAEYVEALRKSAEYLDSLYPVRSRVSNHLMPRDEFEEFLLETPVSVSKQLFVLRILDGDEELLARLPESLQRLTERRAA